MAHAIRPRLVSTRRGRIGFIKSWNRFVYWKYPSASLRRSPVSSVSLLVWTESRLALPQLNNPSSQRGEDFAIGSDMQQFG